jgi:CRP-like cAMP-binding protein
VSLEAIEPGDYVGEISLLARAPAAAYVVAAIDCELLVLPAADFYELSSSFPALRTELRTSAEQRTRVYEQRLRVS